MVRINPIALVATIAILCATTPGLAAEGRWAYEEPIPYEPACGTEPLLPEPGCGTEQFPEPGCGMELERHPGCDRGEPGCGMDAGGASGLDHGLVANGFLEHWDWSRLAPSEDPWVLFGEGCGWSAGGWFQFGYNNHELPAFNNRADGFELHQGWMFAEKSIDTSKGFGLGGRIDYVYGTDGPNTQAFGTGERGWDNGFDNGPNDAGYGHAIPQAYLEAGYGDFSVKVGHFFTLIGYEVVPATGNFFYSHAYTFNFSEPFTHTGALATYQVTEDITAYGGYVLGWDSGFDDNGDAYLGGISAKLTDALTLTYATAIGRFGDAPLGVPEKGYVHSVVADLELSEKLNYVFQTDVLDTHNANDVTVRKSFDINQYLFYTLCDAAKVGTRIEWYDAKAGVLGTVNGSDVYAWTTGLNLTPHANVTIRPEIRRDWIFGDRGNVLENGRTAQTTFGIDTIITF